MNEDFPIPATTGTDAFVSYASQDASVANSLVETLEEHGIRCWIAPRDVQAGAQYADAIVRAISNAKSFVLVLSANSSTSSHVGREVERAASKHRRILALRVDAAPLTPALEYFLGESQWVEAQAGQLPGAYARLIEAIRAPEQPGPTGLSPATSAGKTSAVEPKSQRTPILLAAGAGLLALVSAALLADRYRISKHLPPVVQNVAAVAAAPAKSIAVLPFVDMSEKHDQEYFSDGLSEELIDHLAHIPDLKVIARTSSFAFKGKSEDMRSIATKLGVANLLEGSVRKAGGELRITAQLIRASDGVHLWSQTYDRELRDIFKVQDAIAAAVVTALQATLASSSTRERPVNTEAYQAVLRGRYFGQMGTKEDSERAVAAYREATRLDPEYAIAFAELAMTYYARGFFSWMPLKDAYTEARAALDRSLKIDPTLAFAHRALGWLERDYKYDFITARAERERADELDPTDPSVLADAVFYAFIAGHLDEAIRLNRQDTERNPLDAGAWSSLWTVLIRANRLTEAEAAARTALELNPRGASAHCALGLVLLYEHKPDAALKIVSEETDEMARLSCQSDVLWALGRRPEADALLSELITNHGDSMAFEIAERFAVRNEKDKAFMWLDRAYDNRVPEVIYIRTDETLRNLHDDPRYKAFLRKLDLPE